MNDEREPFNPLRNEGDMFKIVVWVALAVGVIAVAALALRAIF